MTKARVLIAYDDDSGHHKVDESVEFPTETQIDRERFQRLVSYGIVRADTRESRTSTSRQE